MSFFEDVVQDFATVPMSADGIETAAFLNACAEIVPIFDTLGPTAFAPVKSDINGNISKLRKKLEEAPETGGTLQGMVRAEMAAGTTLAKGSATDALLWLKRALSFIRVFLREFTSAKGTIKECAHTAYTETLRKYHNFIVRGIFTVAVGVVPDRKGLVDALGRGKCDEATIVAQATEYLKGFSGHLDTLDAFYDEHKLDK